MRSVFIFGLTAVVFSGFACSRSVEVEDGEGGSAGAPDSSGSFSGGAPSGPNGPGNGGAPSGPNGPNGPGAGGAPDTSGPGQGPTTTGEPICQDFGTPCTECVSVACPAEWCGCANNMDCLALFSCVDGCNGDEACNQTCLTMHQDGASAAILVSACAGGPCDASCPQGGDELEPCEQCLYQGCDDEMNACLAEPDCLDLWDCLKTCPQLDLPCQQGCYDDFGDGVEPLQAVIDCSQSTCDGVCGDD